MKILPWTAGTCLSIMLLSMSAQAGPFQAAPSPQQQHHYNRHYQAPPQKHQYQRQLSHIYGRQQNQGPQHHYRPPQHEYNRQRGNAYRQGYWQGYQQGYQQRQYNGYGPVSPGGNVIIIQRGR